jgi:3-hydroxybenzoate 6-monooxygenase
VRRQVLGDGPPRVAGHTTYRSVILTDQMPEDLRWNPATLWAGPKCHLVHYPLSGWKVFNLVITSHNDARGPAAGMAVSEAEVMSDFAQSVREGAQDHSHRQGLEATGAVRPGPLRDGLAVSGRKVLLEETAGPRVRTS